MKWHSDIDQKQSDTVYIQKHQHLKNIQDF